MNMPGEELLQIFIHQSGIGAILENPIELGIRLLFMAWGFVLLILGLKRVEPLLLIPIGIAMILANAPGLHLVAYTCSLHTTAQLDRLHGLSGLANIIYLNETTVKICTPESSSILAWLYHLFVRTEIGPILIFFGIGALSDFRPMLSYPLASIIGAAAQLGIIVVSLIAFASGIFSAPEAMAVGVVGGADGPTTIYTAINIAPQLVGPLTIAVYSYIALIPIIQPPIVRLLVPKNYRAIRMPPPREVSSKEIIAFWLLLIVVVAVLVPNALPLVIALAAGNIIKECGITEVLSRYGKTVPEALLDIATIITMLGVGSTLSYDFLSQYVVGGIEAYLHFLVKAFLCLGLGLLAFLISTVGGIALAWLLYFVSRGKVNPVIGCAGVSAVPISARVAQREANRVDPSVYILYHALGPNVAGVIGTAIVAGFYIGFVKHTLMALP